MSTLHSILVPLIVAAFSSTGAARDICAEELESLYGTEYSEAIYGEPTWRRTLRAEDGSIAQKQPEALARVAHLARLLERDIRPGDYDHVAEELGRLASNPRDDRLRAMARAMRKRLHRLVDPYALEPGLHYLVRHTQEVEARQALRRLADHMWEFVAATLTAGTRLSIHHNLRLSHPELGEMNPAMDVWALDNDGVERWIEVKNAKVAWWTKPYYLDAIKTQAALTRRAREVLSERKIERELLLVKSVPWREHRRLLDETGYERMNFIFLDDPEASTPYGFK